MEQNNYNTLGSNTGNWNTGHNNTGYYNIGECHKFIQFNLKDAIIKDAIAKLREKYGISL